MAPDQSPAQQAFVMAFAGAGLIVIGLIVSILLSFFIGMAVFVLGGLVMLAGPPLTYFGAKKQAAS